MTNTRETEAVSWIAAGFDVRVRQVCERCNQTWMSDLEGEAKALVSALVLNQRTTPLSHREQIKLSKWLYKTGIMLALAYPADARFVLESDYRFFYEHRKPPDNTSICIAGLIPQIAGRDVVRTGWAKPERLDYSRLDGTPVEPPGYRLSFSVLSLICQILRDPHGGKFERPREFRDVWTRVRPVSKGAWPPKRWFPAEAIEDIAQGRIFAGHQ